MGRRALATLGATLACSVAAVTATPAIGATTNASLGRLACATGSSKSPVKHVIYIQFDNTHLERDRANVPSDLQQMPHLLNFLRGNGTLLTNDHTILISHTGGGILSSITGVYPDRHGQGVSNSFRYYHPDGTTGTGVSFAYWTDGIFDPASSTPSDTTPNMLTADGQNAPAPWVPYTRAGCDFGAVGTANTVLENTGPDVPKVFGANSPEAQEVQQNPAQAFADFVGLAVHCSQGSVLCADANHGKPDLLPDEPGGYTGFNGLFGNKYVAPQISSGPVEDLDGNVIQDASGHVGFPGFDGMIPVRSLAYTAEMQEAGIPVTYTYVSDAHDDHGIAGEVHNAFGPGEAGYVAQLKSFDGAFQKFFQRLAADGINRKNTLFVITVEEQDHFAGGQPANAGCDGVTVACQWEHVTCPTATVATCPADDVGEVNVNLRGLLATQTGNTTGFDVHSDMAPAFYLAGNPDPTAAVTRQFERDFANVTATNPYTGDTAPLNDVMVDRVGMNALHMVTGDPLRTPTFVSFLQPDYFGFAGGTTCTTASPCTQVQPGFAWNHGGIVPEVTNTWAGYVGPGVRHLGSTGRAWTDHTDLRPTMLALLGLKDDYLHDGRAVTQLLDRSATPKALRRGGSLLRRLGAAYKQLNAPVGRVGHDVLVASNAALTGTDAKYATIEGGISGLTTERNAVADRIKHVLDGATFDGVTASTHEARSLLKQANRLIHRFDALAASS
jgi:hypothetical protein